METFGHKEPDRYLPPLEFEPGQVWRRRAYPHTRLVIERVARRSVFGPITISGIPLTPKGQVLHSQLRARWERFESEEAN